MSELTDFAKALARWLHRDQVDKHGRPYIRHLERVAAAVAYDGGSEEEIAAAWLHDCIEDDHVDLELLERLLPFKVTSLIDLLTRHSDPMGRNEGYAHRYIPRIAGHRSAVRVKIADLRDNLDTLRGLPDSLRRRYEQALAVLTSVNL